jgi:aminopeptidase
VAWPTKDQIHQGVAAMLDVNLAVRDGEQVLILTDLPPAHWWIERESNHLCEMLERCYLARLVADLAAEMCPQTSVDFHPYPLTEPNGSEPEMETASKMFSSDVIIAITNHSLTHTEAAARACAARARMASMPGFLPSMFEGPMTADYYQVAEDSRRMASLLTTASTAHLTCPRGTDLQLDLQGRSGDVDIGLITTVGKLDNLPAGEAFIAPVEGKAQGNLVVAPRGYASLAEQMTLSFEAGVVCDIQGGGAVGEEYRQLLELPIPHRQMRRRNLAELGIGTNPQAPSVESLLEAEKIMGTVHIAIGDSAHIGGGVEADLHQDFVVWEPDLFLDGKLVIDSGRWLV